GFFLTILAGILSASLGIIFQDDIAALFGRAPVIAQFEVGPWYPLFDRSHKLAYSEDDENAARQFGSIDDQNFLRARISNNSGQPIERVILSIDDPELDKYDFYEFDAVVETGRESDKKVTKIRDAGRTINLGPLAPASTMMVYLWGNRTFGYPYSSNDILLMTERGHVPTYESRYSVFKQNAVLGAYPSTWAWISFFLISAFLLVVIFMLDHAIKSIRSFMKNDDFYLSERVKFENDPKKYIYPEKHLE
ncbi:MAG TPA: hypothetical protein VL100_06120, partial [Croceibacterium sp.]|nr:hypothetical protein [Croceibacterium sp.]